MDKLVWGHTEPTQKDGDLVFPDPGWYPSKETWILPDGRFAKINRGYCPLCEGRIEYDEVTQAVCIDCGLVSGGPTQFTDKMSADRFTDNGSE